LLEPSFDAAAEASDDIALTLANLGQIEGDRTGLDTIVGAPAGEMRDTSAGDHRLGGSASLVDAGATYMFALDHRRRPPRLGQSACQRNARLPGADDHRIIVLSYCHVRFLH